MDLEKRTRPAHLSAQIKKEIKEYFGKISERIEKVRESGGSYFQEQEAYCCDPEKEYLQEDWIGRALTRIHKKSELREFLKGYVEDIQNNPEKYPEVYQRNPQEYAKADIFLALNLHDFNRGKKLGESYVEFWRSHYAKLYDTLKRK